MDLPAIGPNLIYIRISIPDNEHVVIKRGTDAKSPGCRVHLTVGASQLYRYYIGQVKIGLGVHEEAGLQINRFATTRPTRRWI